MKVIVSVLNYFISHIEMMIAGVGIGMVVEDNIHGIYLVVLAFIIDSIRKIFCGNTDVKNTTE